MLNDRYGPQADMASVACSSPGPIDGSIAQFATRPRLSAAEVSNVAECLICLSPGAQPAFHPAATACPRCGVYQPILRVYQPILRVGGSGEGIGNFVLHGPGDEMHKRARLSHLVRRQQRPGLIVGVPIADLDQWDLNAPLPSPAEQLNNIVVWVGEHQESYVSWATVSFPELAAWCGAPLTQDSNPETLILWLLDAAGAGLLERPRTMGGPYALRLTLPGWQRFEQLKRSITASRTAFMAMGFGDAEADGALETCFKPGVALAGFDLLRVIDGQGAGLIDDQIRVGLRTARFVVADLTHENRGAYWEAGFAEGLGRPVIYTCRKAEWDAKATHFDTSHLVTVIWEAQDLADAARRLTATIRATLPGEANMIDPA
jgi:hypothetical protein